ncbi:penicillin-binding protein activator [Amaricoccus sp.]|uniref:penicillin-binding protein activator n=1 Tax=Amaricoccus sp. TaxID=1872485 RepID=UPI001B5139CE|nr:penicillin-binding protein activator [Amaricoccus sp.]MBP7001932.1 penicillin-binding protein activator [Amaricoccus sp.]
MKLSTVVSAVSRRSFALGAALLLLAACETGPAIRGGGGPSVDPNAQVKVALLAPQTAGDPALQRIARDLVNAAQLARADLRNADVDLQVYDTRGTFEGGQSAATQAVAGGAQIILGPLLSVEAAGAQPPAASAGLSMLTFSNNPSVAGPGTYLLGVTPGNSASALAGFALGRGLSRFGVLYVQGEADEVIRDSVVSAVNAAGGQVVSTQAYPYSQQGVGDTVAVMSVALQNAGANAVFLTERSTAGLVADGLRGNGLSAEQALLLGLQPWGGDADTLARPSLQGAVYAAPDPQLLSAFQGRYAAAYGEQPHELAVLAYDGVAAIGALIAEARAQGGSPFSPARLTQPQGFAGANGAFRFQQNGLSQRNLAIVEVRNGAAVVVSRAARGFGGLGN